MTPRHLFIFTFLLIATVFGSWSYAAVPPQSSKTYEQAVRPFLARHCFVCHGEKDRKAGLRLDDLGYDFLEGKTADVWKEVIDRINMGDMPPKEKPRPDAAKSFAVVEWVGHELTAAEREARMAGGRILTRRLNRSEYANTVRDLLRLDANYMNLIEAELPGDGKAEGFDRIGAALLFDYRTYQRLMYDIIALALQTDSTRVISYMARKDLSDGTGTYRFLGNPYGYHTLTHHGEDPERLKWLTQVHIWHMEDWCYFLDKLKSIKEGSGTLLDHVLLARSSSGGTMNAHNNTMLPTILHGSARIDVKHQGHIKAMDKSLGNLWRTMVELMGMPVPSQFMGGECDETIGAIV